MSELFDKQLNEQKELKKTSHKLLQAHEKVCDENEIEEKEKNDTHLKIFLMEWRSL